MLAAKGSSGKDAAFDSIISIVSDADKFKKHISTLKSETARHKDSYEKAKYALEIAKTVDEANKFLEEAKATLDEAKKESTKVRNAANKLTKDKMAAVEIAKKEAINSLAGNKAEILNIKTALDIRDKELVKLESEADRKIKRANKLLAENIERSRTLSGLSSSILDITKELEK